MRPVAILGVGQTVIDEHWDKSLRDLAGEAAFAAMQDSGVEHPDGLFVGNMLSARRLSKSRQPVVPARQPFGPG
jgi:acetyl-CoA C-acetyltransferase